MGRRIIDLAGTRIENGKVLRQVGTDKKRGILWECRCDLCGEIFIEGSRRIMSVHNEIKKRHGHKCSGQEISTRAAKSVIISAPGVIISAPGVIVSGNYPVHHSEESKNRLRVAKMWAKKRESHELVGLVEAMRYTAGRTF